MNHFKYIQLRDSLIRRFEEFEFTDNETLNGQFNIVSASLTNFLPDIPFSGHADIYKKILLHKKLSILEQGSYEVLDLVETENFDTETIGLLKNKPAIICTFHTGSYRVINLLLARHKIPFTLVIGKEVAEKEGELFSGLFNNLGEKGEKDEFRIINAERSNAGLQMLRELKQGRSLVLYIDGNSGSGTVTTENGNCCAVNFLYQQLFARKGIAFLAHVANAPILTIASYRKSWDEIRLRFYDPILPDKNRSRGEFAVETTQRIYDLVASIIQSYPEQWEGWLYVHKVANIMNPANISCNSKLHGWLEFNTSHFGILKLNSIPFLLKKDAYSFYEIDNELYDLLTKGIERPVGRGCFEDKVFKQLYEQKVLCQVDL